MKTASAIARYLAGVIFLVFGLNGFLNFISLPPPGGIAGQFMGALYASHYLWVIFAFQVVTGSGAGGGEAGGRRRADAGGAVRHRLAERAEQIPLVAAYFVPGRGGCS